MIAALRGACCERSRGSVVIAPPGGAMRSYQATLRRLRDEIPDARRIYGGHGPPVFEAPAQIEE